jgi:hypothetical protein
MPKNEISSLIQRGQYIRGQANQAMSSFFHSKEASVLGDLVTTAIVPHGFKRTARTIGRTSQKQSKDFANAKWRQSGEQFLSECLSVVCQMSINSKTLTISGNSRQLCQKFNRVRRIMDAIKFIDATLVVLTEIQNQELIWNRDISQKLARRKEMVQQERIEKAKLRAESKAIVRLAKTVNLFDRPSIVQTLRQYPAAQQSILGALDRLQAVDPDAERHCITSCRTSIESLCIALGQSGDWKAGMCKILPSSTDQSQVKGVHHFLSGKGAHGGHVPTKKDAEYGLQLTVATLKFIIAGSTKE